MYISTPFATSCRSKTCQAAIAMDEVISVTAQAYCMDFSGFMLKKCFCPQAAKDGGNEVGNNL